MGKTPKKPATLHVGLSRNSRMTDTLGLFRALGRAGTPITPHVIEQDWQARRAGQLDAVLIGGGADLHPSLYGERNWGCRNVDRSRDRLEVILAETALENGVPIMGICRGAQLINALLGGTLYQDLWQDLGVRHDPEHRIEIEPELEPVLPVLRVNSSHHQGLKNVGEGLEVLASAPDGIPELIWSPGIIGTQFHPESLWQDDVRWLNLFKWWLAGGRMKAYT